MLFTQNLMQSRKTIENIIIWSEIIMKPPEMSAWIYTNEFLQLNCRHLFFYV